MTKKETKPTRARSSSIGFHLLLALGALVVLSLGIGWWLGFYTQHGEEVIIPELRGKALSEAKANLEEVGLEYEIVDSVYRREAIPGTVEESLPVAGSRVKPGRIVYLTIFASADRPMTMPMVANMSARNAMALLRGMGFEHIQVREVAGEYKDLCLGVLDASGLELKPGSRVSRSTRLTLLVSSLMLDSLRISDLIEDSEGAVVDGETKNVPSPPKPDSVPPKEPEDWW